MSKIDINKELADLIYRFRRLKKAIQEEDLTPAQRAADRIAARILAKKGEGDSDTDKANQLLNTMVKNNLLGLGPIPVGTVPRQPTDEELFGHLVADEETVKKSEENWHNSINNWLHEANKPINSRFKTPEEEQEYWDSIKVSDGGNDYGY